MRNLGTLLLAGGQRVVHRLSWLGLVDTLNGSVVKLTFYAGIRRCILSLVLGFPFLCYALCYLLDAIRRRDSPTI
jgi:hypothetical protein